MALIDKSRSLKEIFEELCKGNLGVLTLEVKRYISDMALRLYDMSSMTDPNYNENLKYLILICNVTYNRTSMEVLPVEDGVYDILLERYKTIDPHFQVGSAIVQFEDKVQKNMIERGVKVPVNPIHFVDNTIYQTDEMRAYFKDQIMKFDGMYPIYQTMPSQINEQQPKISKRTHNTSHNHPDLVGTLDKCKFVLDADAIEKDVYEDDRVKILERDFFVKHMNQGIFRQDQELDIMMELKYDGISVEADCTDHIVSARTRGDTGVGQASDITPMLEGYKFPGVTQEFLQAFPEPIGIKFEAIMTKYDLMRFNQARGTTYANCRTAIIGLFGASDAYKYRDFITLVPLAVDRDQVPQINDREEEVVFLNKFFQTKNCPLRHVSIHGDYNLCLFLIKKYVEEAYVARNYLDFMFDGVVISYLDNNIRAKLGRENFINKYQVAVKFDAESKLTTFLGYTFEVGQTGQITPMIHYAPVEFNGTIHPKSTGSSYKRFMDLGLHYGDIIKVTYTNDVMPYVNSVDCEENRINATKNPLAEFTDVCPVCGSKVEISPTGNQAFCPNLDCKGRKVARMVSMLWRLNLKGFAESTISQLNVYTMRELFTYDEQSMCNLIGPGNASNFITAVRSLMVNPIEDYRIIGSLGFTGLAAKSWKVIFSKFSLSEFVELKEGKEDELLSILDSMSGIGPAAIATIMKEYPYFKDDIHFILDNFNVVDSKFIKYGKQIRFSGCRDGYLEDRLKALGHDADGSAGVTKKTDILLIPYDGYSSTKTTKAPESCMIITLGEFSQNLDKYL